MDGLPKKEKFGSFSCLHSKTSTYLSVCDIQLYLHCSHEDTAWTTARVDQSITSINQWMSANWLKLDMDKTELLWAGMKYCLSLCDGSLPCLWLGSDTVIPCQYVCVLGVVISSGMSQKACLQHQCYMLLLPLPTSVYPAFTQCSTAATIMRVIVTSHIDYCNAVFTVAAKVITNKLQQM